MICGRAGTFSVALVLALHAAWATSVDQMSQCGIGDAECLESLAEETAPLKVNLVQKKLRGIVIPSQRKSRRDPPGEPRRQHPAQLIGESFQRIHSIGRWCNLQHLMTHSKISPTLNTLVAKFLLGCLLLQFTDSRSVLLPRLAAARGLTYS